MKSFFISFNIFIVLLVQFLVVVPKPVYATVPYEASDVLGQQDFELGNANNFYTSASGLASPYDTEIDSTNHRLFIADSDSNRVLVYNLDTDNSLLDSTADYVLGQSSFIGTASHTTAKGFSAPRGLAYDAIANRLYVVDYNNHRILVFDTASISNNEDAQYVLGQADFTTSSNDTNAKGFSYPTAVAIDNTNNRLYVVDYYNHRILVFDTTSLSNNEDAVNVLGQADFLSSDTHATAKGFTYPQGITIDTAANRLFVADTYNSRVLVFDTTSLSDNEDAVNVLGQANFTDNSSDTNIKGFYEPLGLTFDPTTNYLFVAENISRVLVFDTASISDNEDAIYVLGQPDFTSFGLDTTVEGFNTPYGLSIEPATNRLYVADTFNNRILVFDTTSISNDEDAVSVLGQDNFTSSLANNRVNGPNANGFGRDGMSPFIDTTNHRLFVSDSNNCRVLVFNLDSDNNLIDKTADYVLGQPDFTTRECGEYDASSLGYTGQLAYDSDNNLLFVVDRTSNYRVMIFDVGSIVNGEPAVHILGGADINSAGSGGTTQNTFDYTSYGGVAYDTSKKWLYVEDSGSNRRIMVFDLSSGITDGMNASYVLGSFDFITPGNGGTTANEFNLDYAGSLVIDPDTQKLFYLSDMQNRILVFDVSSITNGEDAQYVLGQPDFVTDSSNTSSTGMDLPYGMGYDPVRKLLYVAEYANYRISIFDVNSITNGEAAVAVIGAADFVTAGDGNYGNTVSQTTVYPYSQADVAYDSTNRRLYLGDDGNARVLIFNFVNITNSTLLEGAVGTSYSDSVTYTGTQGTKAFAVTTGSLPTGLSLNSSTGEITGTPTTPGVSTFTITLTDDNGAVGSYTDTQEYTLTISGTAGTSSTSSPKPDGQNSTTEAPRCTDQVASAPDLFQVDRSYNAATVHFTPLSDNVSSYLISYGTDSTAEGYSVELPISHSDGVVSQTINELDPSTSYSFKVRAQKGCMPGDWSSIKKDNVRSSFYSNTTPLRTNNANTNINTNTFEQTNTPNPTTEDSTAQPTTTTQQDSPKPKNTQTTPNTQTSSSWFEKIVQWVKGIVGK